MTPEEIEQHDKRKSAVHEAGHAVVAFGHGVIVKAWLERSETKDARFEKTWVGHIQNVYGGFGADTGHFIGIAGVVAECLDDEPEVSAKEIVEYWKDKHIIPSPSDLEFMPASWRKRLEAVEVALGMLAKQKAFLESVVSELVEHGLVTADRMVMLAAPYFTQNEK
jgi:hypothetical protein